jgi:hypothetical protein
MKHMLLRRSFYPRTPRSPRRRVGVMFSFGSASKSARPKSREISVGKNRKYSARSRTRSSLPIFPGSRLEAPILATTDRFNRLSCRETPDRPPRISRQPATPLEARATGFKLGELYTILERLRIIPIPTRPMGTESMHNHRPTGFVRAFSLAGHLVVSLCSS